MMSSSASTPVSMCACWTSAASSYKMSRQQVSTILSRNLQWQERSNIWLLNMLHRKVWHVRQLDARLLWRGFNQVLGGSILSLGLLLLFIIGFMFLFIVGFVLLSVFIR